MAVLKRLISSVVTKLLMYNISGPFAMLVYRENIMKLETVHNIVKQHKAGY